jgi:signal transduction histidine kinase
MWATTRRVTPPAPKSWLWWLLGLWVCAQAASAFAEPVSQYEFLSSDVGASDIQAAMRSTQWQAQLGSPAEGFHREPIWLRFSAPSEAEVFLMTSTWLSHFDVYLVAGKRSLKHYPSGTSIPLSQRPILHPQFAFPIPPSPSNQTVTVYIHHSLKIQPARYPAKFLTEQELVASNTQTHLQHGIFYGIFVIMLLYNLVVFWAVRDKAHLYFVLYNLGLIGFLAGSDGFSRFYLWPNLPALEVSTPLWLGLAMIAFLQFVQHFFGLKARHRRWVWPIRAIQATTLLVIMLSAGTDIYAISGWVAALVAIEVLFLFGITVYFVRSRNPSAIAFLIASSTVAFVALYNVLVIYGFQVYYSGDFDWVFSAIALQHIVLSVALAVGMRRYAEATQKARLKSMDLSVQVRQLQASTTMYKEHQELQKSVQQAQKLKSIGQLTGGVAHDFNNILASIMGFSELALEKATTGPASEQIRYLQEITHSAQRGAQLVKQLLIYSRSSSKEPRDINLSEALEQTQALLRGSLPSSVILNTHLPEKEITCRLDPILLQQTLINLALNAAEAMQDRGIIDITLANQQVQNLVCTSCLEQFNGEFAVIKVEDNGPGLKDDPHDLFNPFFTSKSVGEGSGMGLSVVHGIVHEHHGHVQLSDRAQTGVRASLYLPRHYLSEAIESVTDTILLVVEDSSMRSFLRELLVSQGYTVTAKASPNEALETFLINPQAFDLVINDHLMTQQTGLDLAQEMRRLRPGLTVAMTTGHPNGLNPKDLERSGIAAVFEKPIKAHLLLAKVKGLLGE